MQLHEYEIDIKYKTNPHVSQVVFKFLLIKQNFATSHCTLSTATNNFLSYTVRITGE